jgi:hypothetical protein
MTDAEPQAPTDTGDPGYLNLDKTPEPAPAEPNDEGQPDSSSLGAQDKVELTIASPFIHVFIAYVGDVEYRIGARGLDVPGDVAESIVKSALASNVVLNVTVHPTTEPSVVDPAQKG